MSCLCNSDKSTFSRKIKFISITDAIKEILKIGKSSV